MTEHGATPARVKNLQMAYGAFSLALLARDAGNGLFTADLDQGVAGKAAARFALLSGITAGQQKMVGELLDDTEDIEKLLRKATKEVTQAKVQMGLNLAVTAVSLCFPPLRGARAVYVALGVTGGRLIDDESRGRPGRRTRARPRRRRPTASAWPTRSARSAAS